MDDTYDVIVIGAGPVGQNVTERSRAGGLSVAVVERELVGGECSYWGCVPSLAAAARARSGRREEGGRGA
jgi:pyruvate/2-oxoglutarate dehydrogenase complex dihydrolipoamide dehydrogenase (E3) component